MTPHDRKFFLEHGYYHRPGVQAGAALSQLQSEFDRVWQLESPGVNQHKLLKYQPFIDLIQNPAILEVITTFFGEQTQLLQYDLLRQGPHSSAPARSWHRDFSFPGERPVTINTLLFLDDITETVGPTRVVPGSQRGEASPPAEKRGEPLEGELAVEVKAGDAIFINSAIWHSGGRNNGDGLRRGIYLYYGYWWLKRLDGDVLPPWQALQGADDQRLQLLGVKMPTGDIHQY